MILMTTADNCLLTSEILGYFLGALTIGPDVTAAVARTEVERRCVDGGSGPAMERDRESAVEDAN